MKPARVLVFGDSIGQGFYDEINGGWVQRLQRDFFADELAKKSEVNIFNLSISGDTSQEVLRRIERELQSRQKGDIVTVIAVGVNDSYEKNGVRRTSEDDFRRNIQQIIEIAKTFGKVLVLGCSACVNERVQPTSWDETLHYSNELLQRYEKILSECAHTADVEFLPLWQVTSDAQTFEEIMPDGVHPNTAGHAVLYNVIKPKLEAML